MAELVVPNLSNLGVQLGQLGQVYQKAQNEAGLRDAFSGGINTSDPQSLAALSARVMPFNPQVGMTLAQLGQSMASNQQAQTRDARDFAFRQDEARRAQTNADRTFGLQQRQLVEKPTVQKVKDAAGNESLVQVFPDGRTKMLDPDGMGGRSEPNNPFAGDGKMTEQQSKDRLFAGRLFGAEQNLRKFEMQGTDRWQNALNTVGGKIGWNLNNKDYQQFDQAKRDYLNAVLRKESGAVISEAEFANGDKQYFPQPGDSQEVIAQKRANRAEAIKGIAAGAGQQYRPPYTFDDKGGIAPLPPPAARGRQQAVQGDPIAAARAAIQKGAPRDAVIKRLQEAGIPADGL